MADLRKRVSSSEAQKQGATAYKSGSSELDNPHKGNRILSSYWLYGYRAEQQKAEKLQAKK